MGFVNYDRAMTRTWLWFAATSILLAPLASCGKVIDATADAGPTPDSARLIDAGPGVVDATPPIDAVPLAPALWHGTTSAVTPSAEAFGAAAYDQDSGLIIRFGGGESGGAGQDMWSWDGADWAQMFPNDTPPIVDGQVMTYDEAHHTIVLFSGNNGAGPNNQTWLWDGTDWSEATPSTAPAIRALATMVYDTVSQTSILFGGLGNTATLNDTWQWDGSNWEQLSPSTAPPPRLGASMCFDQAHGQVVLFGGAPSLFGTNAALNDTWLFDGTNWTQASPVNSPAARSETSMAYDALRGNCVLFGGFDLNAAPLADTWTWDGSNWTQLTFDTAPPARGGANFVAGANYQLMLAGGTIDVTSSASTHDTWWYGSNLPR